MTWLGDGVDVDGVVARAPERMNVDLLLLWDFNRNDAAGKNNAMWW